MKYLLSRILLLLLLCFAVEPVSRAAISSRLLTLPTNGSVERWMSDTIARKDTLNTAEAAVKARFDSLERRLSPPVDTVELVKKNSKAVAAPWAASQDLQRQLKKQFVPNPQRALWLSLVIPGGGQIYNRKYWKLPLFYGGFLGCTYAFLWNQQMYMDYSQAYLDIMDDDPLTNSFRNLFPPTYDIDSRLEQFKTVFKNRKDRYRRYRDLSAFCFIGVYLLSVVDAYVDAQLSVFASVLTSPCRWCLPPSTPSMGCNATRVWVSGLPSLSSEQGRC